MKIVEREFSPSVAASLVRQGLSPVLAKAIAARGVEDKSAHLGVLQDLLPYTQLRDAVKLAEYLADAIVEGKELVIVADYDADGATACAVGYRALKAFGARVRYLIPHRMEHGYGLSPEIVEVAAQMDPKPDYIITVDNGIASLPGVDRANELGIQVLITDHHLPGPTPPNSLALVNPNQHGCTFPSKALAGCGVIWYVMWALQDILVERDILQADPHFNVSQLLPIVAVGTVADVVPLDFNNRILVSEGVRRIRANNTVPGIDSLAIAASRDPRKLATSDIAFGIGPQINAAGRLESMDSGVECLITDKVSRADVLAAKLHEINGRRKEIEGEMTEEAINQLLADVKQDRYTAVLHSSSWHQGVIGIVAGRIKERIWRPTFALADADAVSGQMKGSGRSIPGFHLRDALDMVDRLSPGLLLKYGGHAMAAGVTLRAGGLADFQRLFEEVARKLLTPADLNQVLETDGPVDVQDMTLDTVDLLRRQVWGQAFPEPSFSDEFTVVDSRSIGDGKHLKLILEKSGVKFGAVKFRHLDGPPPKKIRAVFKMDANTFRGNTSLQLLVDHYEPA